MRSTFDPDRGPGELELWCGIECTVNRVRDRYMDQLERTGHAHRLDDLKCIASLGTPVVRYPVLWERAAPDQLDQYDWRWTDERLHGLRALGVQPIAGLVHHGSGPRGTSLIDPEFGEKLARYAHAVAERYPWIEAYTPVNEPLTTARFSALYGLWHPHACDYLTFLRALLNQCRGIVLAMRAIREVNPAARLVQTEDMGKVFSTPALQYQADYENDRRWLSLDLLTGTFAPGHRLWNELVAVGIEPAQLDWFMHNPCPPDIVGLNYYVTSERFLDENLESYPIERHGGNRWQAYADVAAARVAEQGLSGINTILMETWHRYGLPLAVTEAHLGCTREEQMRWIWDIWRSAYAAREAGADVRAVTAWALFGAAGWCDLLVSDAENYEQGAYDVRAPAPRATAIVSLLRDLAAGRQPSHPLLAQPGWWRRPERLLYPAQSVGKSADEAMPPFQPANHDVRPLLIRGDGMVGQAFAHFCHVRSLPYRVIAGGELRTGDVHAHRAMLASLHPWAVVDTDDALCLDDLQDSKLRHRVCHSNDVAALAAACAQQDIALVWCSADLVFDGGKREAYVESDPVNPCCARGRSMAAAERLIFAHHPRSLVIRTGPLFGAIDGQDYVGLALEALAEGRAVNMIEGRSCSPTYLPELVNAALDLLLDGEAGLWHLAHVGEACPAELLRMLAAAAGLAVDPLRVARSAAAVHPHWACAALRSERGWIMPRLEQAVDSYLRMAHPRLMCT